jgi:hypothetical protein
LPEHEAGHQPPPAAEAVVWLTYREGGAQIRRLASVQADDQGDTITSQRVDLCRRLSPRRVVCWYEAEGYDIDGYDQWCCGSVRVIEYTTHHNVPPIRHGRFRFRCY